RLGNILDSLEKLRTRLDGSGAQVGRALKDNEFLAALRQRNTIPGGTCGFDLPSLQHWLSLPADERRSQLARWLQEVDALSRSLRLVLMLLRESSAPQAVRASGGVFQQSLESGTSLI